MKINTMSNSEPSKRIDEEMRCPVTGFTRLSGDYYRGYLKALLNIQDVFEYVQRDLLHHKKRMTGKIANDLILCCIQNRYDLQDAMDGYSDGFIRWNHINERFEFYNPKKKR